MSDIKTFSFKKESFDQIKKYHFGSNWPVVYLIENGKEIYIGETTRLYGRSKEHFENPERNKLKNIHVISDEEYNKSAALDIESSLIRYIAAEGSFLVQNGNDGLQNHNYYDREKYRAKFETIWCNLQKLSLVKKDLLQIKNSDLFKYSPYKSLNEDQLTVANSIYKDIKENNTNTFIVSGKPGTGKTILATFLFKFLKEKEETRHMKIGLVIPMSSLRGTISTVFSKIKGLRANMVIGPNEVVRERYDLLIVDESHRLQRRKGIMGFGAFDKVNKILGLNNEGNQLDWIMRSSKHQVFFYDENQSIKPADVRPEDFKKLNAKKYVLNSQMRVEAGEDYINFIEDFFDLKIPSKINFNNYDFKHFDDLDKMVQQIKSKDTRWGLARIVAGYAWPWNTRLGNSRGNKYDIDINGNYLVWNSTTRDWVNSPNAINEVGCIHTVQGYDLNYVGVIIGPEFSYDFDMKKFKVDKQKYFDTNGRNGITDPDELERYIVNIYKTLLTRGIKGTYVYIVDVNLREYFKKIINIHSIQMNRSTLSPYSVEMIKIPLVGSAPCGNPLLAEENIEDYIEVEKSKIRPGAKYFIVKAKGDSMNLAGIKNNDLVLCRYSEKGETGDRVVALLGGDNVTIKYYDKKDGRRILLPKSTNKNHKPIVPEEGDMVQGVVQEVLKN